MGALPMFWVKNLKSREGTRRAPLFDFLAVLLTLLLWALLSLASGVSLPTHLDEVSGSGQSQGLLPPERPHYVSRPQHLPPISPKKARGSFQSHSSVSVALDTKVDSDSVQLAHEGSGHLINLHYKALVHIF